jgi:hypothetical protein
MQNTFFGNVFINVKSFLNDNDWEVLENKYLTKDKINFSHICFIFDRIGSINAFRGVRLTDKPYEISKLKRESTWYFEWMNIWLNIWQNAVFSLPELYTKSNEFSSILVNKSIMHDYFFMHMKRCGYFNLKHCLRYMPKWKNHSGFGVRKFFGYCLLPACLIEWNNCRKKAKYTAFIENELKDYCAKHKKLFIYGAGQLAGKVAQWMDSLNIDYDGFILSSKKQRFFSNHRVFRYDEIFDDKNTGIVFAVNKTNQKEIKDSLSEKHINWMINGFSDINSFSCLPEEIWLSKQI